MPADPHLMNRLTRPDGPRPKIGIVHLGPGAFFRAFNAIYTDQAMACDGGDWGILAVSLRSATARDQLTPQGGRYTAVCLSAEGEQTDIVDAIQAVLVAPEDPAKVLDAMCQPEVKIVSLTITEKGYCHDPATGRLRLEDAGVQHDLAHPDQPQTAPGFIVEALARRRAAGLAPFTVMSCDNLPSNGVLARGFIFDFAAARDRACQDDLADWIAENGAFPSTMVDRITPATTAADVARLQDITGYHDPACVMHEPFRQWVIEDSFVNGARPAWDQVGAQLVHSVEAHEMMKLRCLNGTHSTLAYLGYLAGYETIAETVADPAFAQLCEYLWAEEIVPTLDTPEGEDLTTYIASLLDRYRNPAIRHRTWQIAMDGSQKLPQRLLGTLADQLERGGAIKGLTLAVAGWMRYVGGTDENGALIDVRDPLADRLRKAADQPTPADTVAALLAIEDIFDQGLAQSTRVIDAVTLAYEGLIERGSGKMVAGLLFQETLLDR